MDGSVENKNNSNIEKEEGDIEIEKAEPVTTKDTQDEPLKNTEVLESNENLNSVENQNSDEKASEEINPNKTTEVADTKKEDGGELENKTTEVAGTKKEDGSEPENKTTEVADTKKEDGGGSENNVTDVFGTGEIMKETQKKGKGQHTRPNFGEVCIFNVTTKLLDGTVLDKKSNFKCILGHLEVVQALDLTLMLMEIGETAKITSVPKFATPKLDFNPKLPEGTEKLVYEVELLDVDPIPNYYNMSSEELCKVLLRKKELGNFSIAQDDHTTALSTYNYAKEIIDQATSSIDTSIKVAIWNNMAACYLKMENHTAVVDHTNKVLLLQPTNVKAMFRKGKALGLSGNYKEALEVLNKGIKIAEEKDLKLFHQAAAEFKHKMNKANEKERAMYKAMFNPDSKSTVDKKNKASSGLSWWTLGAAAAVVVALGAALIKVNLSNT